jgi:hypothetical protein
MSFCTIFKKIQESSPYMYVSVECNKSVCKQVICDAHDKRFTKKARETYVLSAKIRHFRCDAHDKRFTKKARETYVLSAKIRHFSLANWNIRFDQENQNIWFGKSDHPIFPDRAY